MGIIPDLDIVENYFNMMGLSIKDKLDVNQVTIKFSSFI